MELTREQCYRALASRDARFDGRFFVGVRTTGVYCRPVCRVRLPKLENVAFYPCAAAAEEAGFRACLRCRPETSPGTPAWLGSSAVVSRALRLVRQGALDEHDVGALADRLGVGERHLRRLFAQHLGSSPAAVARALRLHFARTLLDDTDLPFIEVAFAAGYGSVRQFNHAIRTSFGRSPTALRQRRRLARETDGDAFTLRLPYRAPFDWDGIRRFLALRAIPGVEAVTASSYRRTVALGDAAGVVEIRPLPGESALAMRVWGGDAADLFGLVERARRVFDLGADPAPVDDHLARCPTLAPLVRARPGLRVPGAWDPFEVAVRAILGQQVSVPAARTMCGRLAGEFGRPTGVTDAALTRVFPTAEALADAGPSRFALPRARAETLHALARAVADRSLLLDASRGLDDAVERLCALPGIGPWTAHYVAMRALGEPDAFPASDLGLRKAASVRGATVSTERLEATAEAWRPWRAYAAVHLWQSLDAPDGGARSDA